MTVVHIKSCRWFERIVRMRLPFQFGNTEVTQANEAYCVIDAEVDGQNVVGESAQLMVPRWFDKRQSMSNDDTVDELRSCVAVAVAACVGLNGTALEITRVLRRDTIEKMPENTPRLAAGFGPALVEIAVIDAICRAKKMALWQAAKTDQFGLVDGCPSDLTPEQMQASLSSIAVPDFVRLRHTIGFDAPLRDSDITADAPQDGLPVSVEQVREIHGITAFKIKLKGHVEADLSRLLNIAAVLDGVSDLSVTFDANEQYDLNSFKMFLEQFQAISELSELQDALRFIEQPFARETALTDLGPVNFAVPVVIDESDDHEDAFALALQKGWAGTSIKSCKGVLRAFINRARAHKAGAILSGEDLTCQPGLCWQQDTAMAAACGVVDIERNGHHFAGGMQGATDREIEARVACHPDIYTMVDGKPALRIVAGQVEVSSLGREVGQPTLV